MSVSAGALREHLHYTAWASQRLVHAVEQLSHEQLTHDFQTADHSLLGTLVHVFRADRVWLARLKEETAPPFNSESDLDLRVLQTDWPRLYARWLEWAENLTDESALERIAYHDLKGVAHITPVFQIVLHVVNHGTHHRGQAAGFLRALGHTPPPLDLIRYYRDLAASAGASTAGA